MSVPSHAPSHVTFSRQFPTHVCESMNDLLVLAARIADVDVSTTEVHIKQGSRPAHGVYGSRSAMTGTAYFFKDGRPISESKIIRTQHPDTMYLVTLKLTQHWHAATYPYTWQYRRYKTAPSITLNDWQEEFLHLAAHEFVHIDQFQRLAAWKQTGKLWGKPQLSELETEGRAHEAVYVYREMIARVVGRQQAQQVQQTLASAATRTR